MHAGKTVFSQTLQHVPRYEFSKCVEKYNGNYRIRKFPCYDQFLSLAFAHLIYRENLRDIETCLNSHRENLYHIGFRGQLSRSTVAEANERRDYRTSVFSVPAQSIADIYKQRWHIEFFFKWIKQHLRIKAFYGTSPNAVKTQIWVAMCVYLLVAIMKKRLDLPGASTQSCKFWRSTFLRTSL